MPAPAQPAIASVSAQPAPARAAGPAQDGRFSKMAAELAKTPGTGADLMGMVNTDLTAQRTAGTERQRLHQEGLKLFMDASKNNDVASMRAISQR